MRDHFLSRLQNKHLAVVLTQKVDPQYWSKAAAHMVHSDSIAFF